MLCGTAASPLHCFVVVCCCILDENRVYDNRTVFTSSLIMFTLIYINAQLMCKAPSRFLVFIQPISSFPVPHVHPANQLLPCSSCSSSLSASSLVLMFFTLICVCPPFSDPGVPCIAGCWTKLSLLHSLLPPAFGSNHDKNVLSYLEISTWINHDVREKQMVICFIYLMV